MTRSFSIGLVVFLLPGLAFANTPKDDLPLSESLLADVATPSISQQTLQSINLITEKELLSDTNLFNEVISQAIDRQDVRGLQILLPVYATLTDKDDILYLYANAVVQEKHDINQAILYYQSILQQNPTLTPIRVRLILALLANHQVHVAQKQLDIAKQDGTLPAHILASIEKQFTQLTRLNTQFSVRYLDDDNVNNAPQHSEHQSWQLPKPQSAHGMGYAIRLSKNHYLQDQLSLGIHTSINGKYYWDNREYNDIIGEASPVLSYRSLDKRMDLSIYQQKRYFGGSAYSDTKGARLRYTQPLSSEYQGSLNIDFAKKKHKTRPFLDGTSHAMVLGISHYNNPQYHINIHLTKDDAQDDSESYKQGMILTGFNQTWRNISVTHQFGIGKRSYQDVDIFNIKRSEMIYHIRQNIWHRNLHYKGYHPSLNLHFERVDSNHFAHDSKNIQVFISIDKKF